MKKLVDTNFARAIAILVGALIIFSVWFLTNRMKSDDLEARSTEMQEQTQKKVRQNIETNKVDTKEASDPVLRDVTIDNDLTESISDVNSLEELAEIEDIDFSDINF